MIDGPGLECAFFELDGDFMKLLLLAVLLFLVVGCEKTIHEAKIATPASPMACVIR